MEKLDLENGFWSGKRVFITGHTGFKGSWLSMWLYKLGAEVTGYSLLPNTTPSLYNICKIDELVKKSYISDIRDQAALELAISESNPEIIIHMAAQPLVRESYNTPRETFEINVMGTINVLEAARKSKDLKVLINVTTDKVYENKEWNWGYRENEPLGGYDPYSSSKACSELATQAYRNSFFTDHNSQSLGVMIATARAGNVIGGGDWAVDRLIPDCVRSLSNHAEINMRNPHSIRPWQHVLEPLGGYMLLAEKLYTMGPKYTQSWNFGPEDSDAKNVEWIVKKMCEKWGGNASYKVDSSEQPHEATYLKLDCSKAKAELNWRNRWNIEKTIDEIVIWSKAYQESMDMREITFRQIEEYSNS